MRRRPSFGCARSAGAASRAAAAAAASSCCESVFFQQPRMDTPLPPPVAAPFFSNSTAFSSSSAVAVAAAGREGCCSECRWRAAQEQQSDMQQLACDRLFPARSVHAMVAVVAANEDDEDDDDDGCGSLATTVRDDGDELVALLEPDDLWEELCAPDPPRVVYASSTSALTVLDASLMASSSSSSPQQQQQTPTSPSSSAAAAAAKVLDEQQSPEGTSAAARSSSSHSRSAATTTTAESVAESAASHATAMSTATVAPSATGALPRTSGLVVHAASLNRLVQLLTPENGRPDATLSAAFFLTYPRFTTTTTVVRKLLHRFVYIPAAAPPPHRVLIRVSVLRALAALLASDPRDLSPTDAKLIALFAREARAAGYQEDVEALEAAARSQQRNLAYSVPSPQVLSLGVSFPVRFHELSDVGLVRLHQQFCLVEYSTYDMISPRELLVNWESPRTAHLAPNLRTMVRRFNAITNWATSLILQASSSETRTQVVDMLVQLADFQRQSNNFQVLNAVLAGISKSVVSPAVQAALAKRPERRHKLQELQELMDNGKWLHLMKTCTPPLIPFFGKFQSDLVHIDDSMRDMQPDGQIIFTKQLLLHRTILELLRGKGRPYLVKVEPCLHFYVQTLPDRLPDEQLEAIQTSSSKPRSLRTTSMRTISRPF